jgi:hypothetical protein
MGIAVHEGQYLGPNAISIGRVKTLKFIGMGHGSAAANA